MSHVTSHVTHMNESCHVSMSHVTYASRHTCGSGCLVCIDYFPPKGPIVSGSFAQNHLQLEASYGSRHTYR